MLENKKNLLLNIPKYMWAALFSGITIGLCVCISDSYSPYLAGFIASFPVALSSMLFVKKESRLETSRSFTLGILIYSMFALLHYNLVLTGWDQNTAIYMCVAGWLSLAIILYYLAK